MLAAARERRRRNWESSGLIYTIGMLRTYPMRGLYEHALGQYHLPPLWWRWSDPSILSILLTAVMLGEVEGQCRQHCTR